MNSSIIFMILLQVVLIGLNAIFASAEIAVIAMNDTKLEKMAKEGDKRAIRLVNLTEDSARFLATIQVAITLSGFLGSAFAADNFADILVRGLLKLGLPIPEATLNSIAVVAITLFLSYFTLVFGELVPKQVAMKKTEQLALRLSGLISAVAKVCKPIVAFLTFSTNTILRLFGIDPNEENDTVSEEEIRMMVDAGSQKGTIDNEEKEFIQNIFEFDDIIVDEIATHRTEVTLLFVQDSMEVWENTIYESRHSLYPICDDSADNVIGILNTKEYFRLKNKDRESVMREAVFAPYFVPETITADVLFRNMKLNRVKMAIVMDEYGGMTGIITLNDLVELLVGDLSDEEDISHIENIDEQTWKVHGSVLLKDLEEILNISLPSEESETFNGFVFDVFEAIPKDGTVFEIESNGLSIKVTKLFNHQIEEAIVKKQEMS